MHTRAITFLLAAAFALLALAPTAALAVGTAPDQMVDPAGAMEPELSEEAEPAPAPETGGDVTTAASDSVTVDGSALEPGVAAAPPAVATGAGQATVHGGTLPFTGPGDGQITLLIIVGSLLLASGATAWSAGRPAPAER